MVTVEPKSGSYPVAGQASGGLPDMTCRLAHRRQQQRPAGDGLHTCARVGRPAVPAPPVVDQRTGACRGLAAVDVLCGEATHSPLVLELVKSVIAIGTVSVELPDRLRARWSLPDRV